MAVMPHVDLFVLPVRHGVFVLASGRRRALFCLLAGSARRLCCPLLPRRSSRNAFGYVTTEGDVFLPWFASGACSGAAGAGCPRSVGDRRAVVHCRALHCAVATGDTRLSRRMTQCRWSEEDSGSEVVF